MKNRILLLLLSFCCTIQLFAQSLYEVSLDEKVKNSSLIIEGKVVSEQSFWNDRHTLIYTSHSVEVYKVFKGALSVSTIDIVTAGGKVGDTGLVVSDAAKLVKNDIGTFFLQHNNRSNSFINAADNWNIYSSAQGFLKYDLRKATANAPFAHYKSVSGELYNAIKARTRKDFENRKPSFNISAVPGKNSRELSPLATPVISGFSPAVVTAGTFLDPANNVLTINGSGFGTGGGLAGVYFDDPDDGAGNSFVFVTYDDPLVISWTDTQIQIRVPGEAGTGQLYVQESTGLYAAAPGNLDVLYSIQNYNGHETTLIDQNGSGGYTIAYSTNTAGGGVNFDTDPAKQTFQRALTTWKESVGANIVEGGTTSIQSITFDGVCTIMFDNQNTGVAPLASGVLAVCYSWYLDCGVNPAINQAVKGEFEVVIRSAGVSSGSATFTLGPCPPNASNYLNIDLETVILHELGHALNLGHVNDNYQGSAVGRINPGKLMNWAVVNSVRRNTPDYSAKAGALYVVTPQGAVAGSCVIYGEMTPLTAINEPNDNCPASFPATPTPSGTSVAFDLVHAGSNRFVDPAYTQVRCDGLGASITNNAYYAFRTSPAGGILSLIVSGYTTTPAALTSCTQVYGGVPVTGVRLSVYQASSCPSAGAFPTPVNCQVFSANGALSNITGLAANTNYLIYLEGVENTKAAFSLTFGGSVLPIRFESFTGKILSTSNQLNWAVSYYADVKRLVLEKSSNGADYVAIDSIPDYAIAESGSYIDAKPFAGNNYYRLAAVNVDGSKKYSTVVILERKDKFLAAVYPNPANNSINLDLSAEKTGRFTFDIYNAGGQLVQKQTNTVLQSRQTIHISALNLANGVYFLKISNEKGEPIKNITFTVKH